MFQTKVVEEIETLFCVQ